LRRACNCTDDPLTLVRAGAHLMTRNSVLPNVNSADWAWQVSAACRGLGDELFYGADRERGRSKRRREQAAKAVCAACPTVMPCLLWAMATGEPYGVWGGLTPEERHKGGARAVER
jgi:WhiB family redox-sensing transcriptional regulator